MTHSYACSFNIAFPSVYKFTGKERDTESGLDNFGARYNASTMGRFMSPDPIHIMKQKFTDPQQWNMYSYVRNNPLRFIDPTGAAIKLSDDAEERKRQLDAAQQAVGKDAGKYLYTSDKAEKDGHYYLKVYAGGPSGKGTEFGKLNSVHIPDEADQGSGVMSITIPG